MNPNFYKTPLGETLGIILVIWAIFWHGLALWRSAKSGQKYWFVVLLIISLNTIGIIEIVYLFKFAKKPMTMQELSSYFKNINFDGVKNLGKRNKK